MDCGSCTLCCKLLETHDIQSSKGEWPKCCDPAHGCKIYSSRPKECRDYECMWLQMEKVEEELRPDNSHIIFEKVSEAVILGLQDPDYELTSIAKNQISYFIRDGFSVALINKGKKGIYLARGHTIEEVGRIINDSSELYRRLNRF